MIRYLDTLAEKTFNGSTNSPYAMCLAQLAKEPLGVLAFVPSAQVKIALAITAEIPAGAIDPIKRAVFENAKTLERKSAEWK